MDHCSKRTGAFALAVSAIFSISMLVSAPLSAAEPPLRVFTPADAKFVPGEVLVKFRPGFNPGGTVREVQNAVAQEAARLGVQAQVVRSHKRLNVHRLRLKERGVSVEAAINRLRASGVVEFAEPNYIYRKQATIPNDPWFSSLWGLNNTGQTGGTADADIDAPEAWDRTMGSSSVVVAVIDTGVAYMHPDLAANMWVNPGEIPGDGIDNDGNGYVDDVHGINAITGTGDPFDDNGHGTHVAGTIGAVGNNALTVVGVSPNVKIIGCKFLAESGFGSTSDALECVLYLLDLKRNGVNLKAMNNSWGGGGASLALLQAIELARDENVLFIAAAGNSASDNDWLPHYPSNYNVGNVIAVAATDHTDSLAGFSNYGSSTVHVGAPGSSILSTVSYLTYTPAPTDPFFDDMESANANWTADAPWARSAGVSSSGAYAWTDSPSSNYGPNVNASLTSRVIDLSGTSGFLRLGYNMRMDLDFEICCDSIWIEFSPDGGATWFTQTGWTGSTFGGFSSFSDPIPEAFRTANFRFRFRLQTDASNHLDGVYIDNVGVGQAVHLLDYDWFSGTSMATPHVTGLAALAAAYRPAATADTIRKAILDGADVTGGTSSTTYTGGRINARRTLDWFDNAAPTVGAVTPGMLVTEDGVGTTLSATFSDANGAGDLEKLSLLVGPTAGSPTNAFWVEFFPPVFVTLKSNNGQDLADFCALGSSDTLVTSRVTIDCATSSATTNGNSITLNLTMIPTAEFGTGVKRNVFLRAQDSFNAMSPWTDRGDWTVKATNVTPGVGSLVPSQLVSPPLRAMTLTAGYQDSDGGANIAFGEIIVNATATGVGGIHARYDRTAHRLWLYNDADSGFVGSCVPGAAGTLTNSRVTLNCAATTVSSAASVLTVNWNLNPKATMDSTAYRNVYLMATDYSGAGGTFSDRGNWKITSVNVAPVPGTVTPSSLVSVAGVAQTLAAVYTDADGFGNIDSVRMLVNTTASVANGIYVRYVRSTDMLQIYNDAGNAVLASCKRGSAATLENSRGSLSCAATTVVPSGSNLTVNWRITPKPLFAAATTRNVYLYMTDNKPVNAGFADKGNWTINP